MARRCGANSNFGDTALGALGTALGALGTAFTLLYAIVGVPFSRMADRLSRKPIIAVGVSCLD